MQISITGRHVDITDAIREYAYDKLTTLSEFPRIENVHMILDVQKHHQEAEVVIQAKDHIRVDARDKSDNMYASIDGAVDKAYKQLRRLRDKVTDHKVGEGLGEIEVTRLARDAQSES